MVYSLYCLLREPEQSGEVVKRTEDGTEDEVRDDDGNGSTGAVVQGEEAGGFELLDDGGRDGRAEGDAVLVMGARDPTLTSLAVSIEEMIARRS